MERWRQFLLRVGNVFRSSRAEHDLDRELTSHLALLEDEYERRGLTPDEARMAARRALGGVDRTKELHRDARSFRWIEDARLDVRYALRTLRRTPGFAVVAVVTLALGIGANTAIFSVINAVLLRPLPYADSDRLVRFVEAMPTADGAGPLQPRTVGLSISDLATLRAQSKTLSLVGVYMGATMTLTGRGEPARVEVTRVSPTVFTMVGARPSMGRTFDNRDETPQADPVAILSQSAWRRFIGGSNQVLGASITLDGRVFSIVGVMPATFQFPDTQTQLWIPYVVGGPTLRARVPPIVRLADGVSIEAATFEMRALLPQLQTTLSRPPVASRIELISVLDQLVAPVKPALIVIAAAVGFVLLIACVNVANLVLARSAARQGELAVRAALGAGRGRLVRQLFAESLTLSALGGIAGIALAFGSIRLLQSLGTILPRRDLTIETGLPRLHEIGIDPGVLVFTIGLTVLTGILSGVAPAAGHWRSWRSNPQRSGHTIAPGARRAHLSLVVAEIAMSTLLLVGGGLLIRSFVKLASVDPGFNRVNVLTFNVLSGRPRDQQRPFEFAQELETRLRGAEGIRAVGYAEIMPLVRFRSGIGLRRVAAPPTPAMPPPPPAPGAAVPPQSPDTRVVSRGFFEAMGMRIVAGRGFGDDDGAGRPKVMLVNQTLARSGYLGPNPVGERVYAAGPDPWEVIGVVDDVRQYGLDQRPDPQIFIDVRQLPSGNPYPYFAVRVDRNPTALVPTIRSIARQIDPEAFVDNVATMEQIVSNSIARPRLYAVLMALFAGAAGALALIGIYGVMSYAVTQRTREIGIRMALGAQRTEVLGLVLRQSTALTVVGIALGLAGAAGASRWLEGMLFGITPLDVATFVVVPVLFALVALLASYVPARRATRVDPLIALRCE